MPLVDGQEVSPIARAKIAQAHLVIGESRKTSFRVLAQVPGAKDKPLFLLDESSRPEEKAWEPELRRIAQLPSDKDAPQTVILFSDTGMPLLFDPGREVLELARELDFEIRSLSGATSWGTACALSGWQPPFLIVGFSPRDEKQRGQFWQPLIKNSAHLVLMERPYRLLAFLDECKRVFGSKREAFLAWEIDSEEQKLIWGSLDSLCQAVRRFEKNKGEFILLIRGTP